MIKRTKRLHKLYQDWLKLKEFDDMAHGRMASDLRKRLELRGLAKVPTLFDQPLAGKWYYEYRNDKGGYVGLAKLQDHNFTFTGRYRRKWMWETCTTNEGTDMELRRFPSQKEAEKAIYKFLK